jgi:hypothetical protein
MADSRCLALNSHAVTNLSTRSRDRVSVEPDGSASSWPLLALLVPAFVCVAGSAMTSGLDDLTIERLQDWTLPDPPGIHIA